MAIVPHGSASPKQGMRIPCTISSRPPGEAQSCFRAQVKALGLAGEGLGAQVGKLGW